MVGWVKYGPDCWMIEGDGKCRVEAEARGLPADKKGFALETATDIPHTRPRAEKRCTAQTDKRLKRASEMWYNVVFPKEKKLLYKKYFKSLTAPAGTTRNVLRSLQ